MAQSTSFDYEKHLLEISHKYRQFIKDFELEDYIELMYNKGIQNCTECHFRPDEPKTHRLSKSKIYKLFLHNNSYLVESEVSAKKNKGELQVFDIGKRGYAFDILVINVKNLIKLFNHVDGIKKLDHDKIIKMEHDIIFSVEVDGGYHSWKKDRLRDLFFLEEYNIVTVRYQTTDVIRFQRQIGMRSRRRHSLDLSVGIETPDNYNLSVENILLDARAIYHKKYKMLKFI